jgi:hypothetical protein
VGKIVSIERQRTVRLADDIEGMLRRGGDRELRLRAEDVEEPTRWRRAAVMAGHRLGYPTSTWAAGGWLGLLLHRPVTEAERRGSAEAMAGWILYGVPPEF